MRLVVDVNLPPGWASRLGDSGHEAQHWSQIGPLDATAMPGGSRRVTN
jgi:predicted nuclease of predicted toxin-antitoxin system